MFTQFLRQEGDGGGSEEGAGSASDESQNDAAKGSEEGAKGAEGDKGGSEKDEKPTVENLTAKLAELTGKNESLASKLGKQSNLVATTKEVQRALTNDPEGFIRTLAKKHGVSLPSKPGFDASKALAEGVTAGDGDALSTAIDKMLLEKVGPLFSKLDSRISTLFTTDLAQTNKDWDDLEDERLSVQQEVEMGKLSEQELYHFAARDRLRGEAIKAAKKAGKEEYIEELRKKKEGGVPGSGGSGGGKGDEDSYKFEDLVKKLS